MRACLLCSQAPGAVDWNAAKSKGCCCRCTEPRREGGAFLTDLWCVATDETTTNHCHCEMRCDITELHHELMHAENEVLDHTNSE